MERIIFEAVEDFFSEEFDSQYAKGLRYTIHPGNTKLATAVAKWIEQKRVRIVDAQPGAAQPAEMTGTGKVG